MTSPEATGGQEKKRPSPKATAGDRHAVVFASDNLGLVYLMVSDGRVA